MAANNHFDREDALRLSLVMHVEDLINQFVANYSDDIGETDEHIAISIAFSVACRVIATRLKLSDAQYLHFVHGLLRLMKQSTDIKLQTDAVFQYVNPN